jgi:hypothetical protein
MRIGRKALEGCSVPAPRIGPECRSGEPFATSELVLLCHFGLEPEASGPRRAAELRAALVAAGFTATAARHVVRTSALLRQVPDGCYRLWHVDRPPTQR